MGNVLMNRYEHAFQTPFTVLNSKKRSPKVDNFILNSTGCLPRCLICLLWSMPSDPITAATIFPVPRVIPCWYSGTCLNYYSLQ